MVPVVPPVVGHRPAAPGPAAPGPAAPPPGNAQNPAPAESPAPTEAGGAAAAAVSEASPGNAGMRVAEPGAVDRAPTGTDVVDRVRTTDPVPHADERVVVHAAATPPSSVAERAEAADPGGDIGAATAGVAAVLFAASATGFMSFRSARATRVRLNGARAEFLEPR